MIPLGITEKFGLYALVISVVEDARGFLFAARQFAHAYSIRVRRHAHSGLELLLNGFFQRSTILSRRSLRLKNVNMVRLQ